MIVRILGEGQWTVTDEHIVELNKLDDEIEAAVEKNDQVAFASSLAALLDDIRKWGTPLPDDSLEDSDLILPPADATIDEVRHLLEGEGLIPG
ncbi:MAG TPA: hypothetical protein VFZ64_09955 [Nocardioidaceae bacterium]